MYTFGSSVMHSSENLSYWSAFASRDTYSVTHSQKAFEQNKQKIKIVEKNINTTDRTKQQQLKKYISQRTTEKKKGTRKVKQRNQDLLLKLFTYG